MTNDEVNEALLLLLRQYRLQARLIFELGILVDGLREIVVANDPTKLAELERLSAEAREATSVVEQMTLDSIDDIIRKLEAGRKPARTN
jgi:hypothetical protein